MTKPQLPLLLLLLAAVGSAARVEAETHACRVQDVFVFPDRVHVRCDQPKKDAGKEIYFFAVSTKNAETADRFMTLAATALVSGRQFVVNFSAGDTSGQSFHCQPWDCRRAESFGIQ